MYKLNDLEYENIHSHSMYSNTQTPDSIITREDIAIRAKELGHKTLSLVEHGYFSNIFEVYPLAEKYNLDIVFGSEVYFVKDRFEKDRTNAHLLIMAKNEKGRKEITSIISEANKTGFYYRPRIDEELLFSLSPENVIVTTACLASPIRLYEGYADEFITKSKDHFGDNFFLEVQPHTMKDQADFNIKLKEYRKKYNVSFILGIDTHYIYPEDAVDRDMFLRGKNMIYPDESGMIIDYPTSEDVISRFKKQNVLSDEEIKEAFDSTLIAREFEPVKLNKDIKMPSIYPDKSHEEKMDILKDIITEAWLEDRKHIDKEKWPEYLEAIRFETEIIKDTEMEDYFLLNEKIIDKAVNKYGGVLTQTGRGCFTETAPIRTKEGIKRIKDVEVGDKVIASDGTWEEVYDTLSYDIENEDMIEIRYQNQGVRKEGYQVIGTLDHKVLVNREGENKYIPLEDVVKGDYLVSPKSKINKDAGNEDIVIDLNKYNTFDYEYDNDYIYEVVSNCRAYEYSPADCEKRGLLSEGIAYQLSKMNFEWDKARKETLDKIERFFEVTPFKNQEEYAQYTDSKRYTKSIIPRYLKLDKEMNEFIGLLYGDGWIKRSERDRTVGLAINKTSKYGYNRDVFYSIANRLGVETSERISGKGKNLIQLYIRSNIIRNFVEDIVFIDGVSDSFNFDLLEKQTSENIRGLLKGLMKSDGSDKAKYRNSFDSTSPCLIEAFRQANSIAGAEPMSLSVRESRVDDRGYNNKESYKVRWYPERIGKEIPSDDDNWYLKVTDIIVHKNMKTKVYDLSVKNNPSFMIGNVIVHNSGVSFYINKLLGFTEVDRLEAPIELYPTRFMSKSRILETKSLPDIDLNTADPKPFIKASRDILGKDNAYLMVTYGTMRESEAFRNYCRALDLNIKDFNPVGKDIDAYRNHSYWGPIIKESEKFVGVIDSWSPHPCAVAILNKPISKELGIMRIGDVEVALIDSDNSDRYKYLKEDFLTVTVVEIISKTYEAIGRPMDDIRTLIELTEGDDKVWSLYEEGLVATLNQAGTPSGKPQVMQYAPKNIRELSGWVSAIRPAFASMKDYFLNRKEFSYGIPELDKLLESSDNFILYQENIMSVLQYVGFREDETYGLLKAIARKQEGIIEPIQDRFMEGFIEKTGSEENALRVWQIIEDAVDYGFNASHAYSVALDSLYGAYLKANYPMEYFSVILNIYQDSVSKVSEIETELDAFGIEIGPVKFGKSRSDYTPDKKTKTIYKGVSSIKYLSRTASESLYDLSQRQEYLDGEVELIDLLIDIIEETTANSRQVEILINLGYFSDYAQPELMLNVWKTMNGNGLPQVVDKKYEDGRKYPLLYRKTHIDKTKEKRRENLQEYIGLLKENPPAERTVYERIQYEREYIGHSTLTFPEVSNAYVLVTDINTRWTPVVELYQLNSGETYKVKIRKNKFYDTNDNPLVMRGNIIKILKSHEEYGMRKVDGKWEQNKSVVWRFIDQMAMVTS